MCVNPDCIKSALKAYEVTKWRSLLLQLAISRGNFCLISNFYFLILRGELPWFGLLNALASHL